MQQKTGKSAHAPSPDEAIDSSTDLECYFSGSGKPPSQWAIGPEIELMGFTRGPLARIDSAQVQTVMRGFSPQTIAFEMEAGEITEATLVAGLCEQAGPEAPPPAARSAGRITLEPGGQLEFSGTHQDSLGPIERDVRKYLERLREIGDENDIIFLAAGFDPVRGIEEQNWIGKKRYEIMRPYLSARGGRALDMMCRTAAIQVNLDYEDVEDLAKKFTLANRLGPIAAAIFANSPFERGRLSGYKSTRYAVWLQTDRDRTGLSPAAIEDFSIERFLDHVRSVPMFFIRREGEYVNLAGHSFARFIEGGNGLKPIFQDFTDHLSTIFTEARLKPHIEQRSMDCGGAEMLMASLAFWKGLMYSKDSLERACELAPRLGAGEFVELQKEVARRGLQAELGKLSVQEVAREAVELARAGLEALAPSEAAYLDVLEQQVIRERVSPADILIRNFEGAWKGDITRAVDYLRVA
ncbi:MAG TPA: glutamate-cysteine ligase family protein [Blastocatellia bacterium]|nr:glutamate-cysteine ligase family protein [Blastocatellia bacterium]